MMKLIRDFLGIPSKDEVTRLMDTINAALSESSGDFYRATAVIAKLNAVNIRRLQKRDKKFEALKAEIEDAKSEINKAIKDVAKSLRITTEIQAKVEPKVPDFRRKDARFNSQVFDRLVPVLRDVTGRLDDAFGVGFTKVRRFKDGHFGAAQARYLDEQRQGQLVIAYCNRHGGAVKTIDPNFIGPFLEPIENEIRDAFA